MYQLAIAKIVLHDRQPQKLVACNKHLLSWFLGWFCFTYEAGLLHMSLILLKPVSQPGHVLLMVPDFRTETFTLFCQLKRGILPSPKSRSREAHSFCVMRIQDVNARKDEELSPRIQVEFFSKVIYQKALEKKKKSRDRDQGGPEIQKYNF